MIRVSCYDVINISTSEPGFAFYPRSSGDDTDLKVHRGSHFFPNTKSQVFSRFLVLNSRYFHTNFSYKNLEMC